MELQDLATTSLSLCRSHTSMWETRQRREEVQNPVDDLIDWDL